MVTAAHRQHASTEEPTRQPLQHCLQVEAAYDVILMQKMRDRLSGDVKASIKYADVPVKKNSKQVCSTIVWIPNRHSASLPSTFSFPSDGIHCLPNALATAAIPLCRSRHQPRHVFTHASPFKLPQLAPPPTHFHLTSPAHSSTSGTYLEDTPPKTLMAARSRGRPVASQLFAKQTPRSPPATPTPSNSPGAPHGPH